MVMAPSEDLHGPTVFSRDQSPLPNTKPNEPATVHHRPAVIELSVLRGRANRLHPLEWLMLLRAAADFGWSAAGAATFDADGIQGLRDAWYGLTPNDRVLYRAIEADDARRLSVALARAAATVARESDAALMDAAGIYEPATRRTPDPSALNYFVEQGVAADWIEQFADDLTDSATLIVHGDIRSAWRHDLNRFADRNAPTPWHAALDADDDDNDDR